MLVRTSSPLSPSVDIAFDGVSFDYMRIAHTSLHLEENKHDLLKVFVAGLPPKDVTDLDGVPVKVTWSLGADTHTFCGYVTYVEPQFQNRQGLVNNSPLQEAWIYCFGASFIMHGKRTRVWETPTLKMIVDTLAEEYQFSYSIPVDSFQFPRLIQTSESDWAFLVRVVESLGYEVTMHGTHLHIFDRYKAIGRQISAHRLEVPPANANMQAQPGQILEMNGAFGRITPFANSTPESVTTLDNRGVIVKTNPVEHNSFQGRPLDSMFHDELGMNVPSPDYAQGAVEARARHKFPYEATFQCTGTAGVLPGGVVDLDRFGSRFDGLWYVSSVTHTLTFDKFFTEIKAHKDSTNDDPFRIPSVMQVGEYPKPTLYNSSWRAQTQMAEVYG